MTLKIPKKAGDKKSKATGYEISISRRLGVLAHQEQEYVLARAQEEAMGKKPNAPFLYSRGIMRKIRDNVFRIRELQLAHNSEFSPVDFLGNAVNENQVFQQTRMILRNKESVMYHNKIRNATAERFVETLNAIPDEEKKQFVKEVIEPQVKASSGLLDFFNLKPEDFVKKHGGKNE